MRTSKYPYRKLPFEVFNPVQRVVVPFLAEDVNMVIAFATATGKTALAECAFAYHLERDDVCKVLYCAPFKALTSEKHKAWRADRQFRKFAPVSITGDSRTKEDCDESRLILLTAETLDVMLRNSKKNAWLRRVACAVFDEAHLIGDPQRGPVVEASIMRMSEVAPEARIILLSATLDNGEALSRWLKSLNGKPTKSFSSDWQPCEVSVYFNECGEGDKLDMVIRMASDTTRQALVFVHTKSDGAKVTGELLRGGHRVAFHNASLSQQKRANLEAGFRSGRGVRVLVSTSTLGAGVNLI